MCIVPEYCSVADGLKLVVVTASACISMVGEKLQVGQLFSDGSHCDPCVHNLDVLSCDEVIYP